MAFSYRVNLIREEVAARRAWLEMVRVVRLTLLAFAVLSAGTFLIFSLWYHRVETDRERIREISRKMKDEGVDLEKVAELSERSQGLDLKLEVLRDVLGNTVSWSSVLSALGQTCGTTGIKLKRIHTDAHGEVVSLYLEGVCSGTDPIGDVRAFVAEAAKGEGLGEGTLRTIDMETGAQAVFRAEIPLRAPVSSELKPEAAP